MLQILDIRNKKSWKTTIYHYLYCYGVFPVTVILCGPPAFPAKILTVVDVPESSDVSVPFVNLK